MLRTYLGLGAIVAVLVMVGSAYFYYNSTQKTIRNLTEENVRLGIALDQEREKARKLAEFQKAQIILLKEADDAFAAIEKLTNNVFNYFSEINFMNITPEIELEINNAFNDILDSIECETGGDCK